MDIFEFALKMEADGEKYYRDLAGKVRLADLKVVLEGLADDEKRHYEIIQSIQKQDLFSARANPALGKEQNVFTAKGSVDKKLFIEKLKDEQIDAYRAAVVKENESVALYKKLKENAGTQEEKSICERLIHEEEKHAEVLEEIIDMLNHVHDWAEAAEFNHQDNY